MDGGLSDGNCDMIVKPLTFLTYSSAFPGLEKYTSGKVLISKKVEENAV